MTVSVLMIVEGASPEISRCVNVEETMTLGELAQIIDAALGFTGAATHLYVGQEGAQRSVYTEVPGSGEHHEDELTVAEMRPMTYVYDPAANWNIHVEVLGPSNIEGPTPMLIDAAGPDVVEACSGPELMTTFRNQARLLAAGIEPDLETITLMFSYLPVMPPERMLDRMTQADPVAVATRIGNVAEEMFFDEVAAADEQSDGPGLAQHFDDFLQSRPDLLQIIDMDPHPERNPSMINAVTEFFGGFFGDALDGAGDLTQHPGIVPGFGPGSFTDIFAGLIRIFAAGVPYEHDDLPADIAHEVRELVQLPFANTVADLLLDARMLKKRGGELTPTKAGETFLTSENPIPKYADNIRRGFEALTGEDMWRAIVGWLVGGQPATPEMVSWLLWLEAFGIARETGPNQVVCTEQGSQLLELHYAHYANGR
ncbi:hypothetical protein GC584_03990 [Corynebacterium sp. zg912]|uniref:Plasmid pRiA4b Orf3-like domain-containing protein n=1 Tax=Corynebacterium wankanglinii TaxID=2735136 RepID=A0A7H0K9W4_9CORY|nr:MULTISPECIES: hypothetical protein [Corynebacterium]MBA1836601.1 hypothetical protein [Corynebacterium wankanglinii]MCR5928600.1 hypothetical protein [Corynebacterium sp. zg912]QNP94080.1 hypothetical protein IA203_00210 [Corynebacterium wankanglinii]